MANRPHSSLRIAVGLALTGCAFVVAGRRTHAGPLPSHAPVSGPPESPTTVVDAAGTVAEPPAPLAPEPPGATVESEPTPVRRDGSTPSDQAVAFDAVMARITTLIDAASRSGLPTQAPTHPPTTMPSDTGTRAPTQRSPAETSVGVATLVRPEAGAEGADDLEDVGQSEANATTEVRWKDDLTDRPEDEVTEEIASEAALFLAENAPTAKDWPGAAAAAVPRPPATVVPVSIAEAVAALRRTGLDDEFAAPVVAGLHEGSDLETLLLQAFSTLAPPPPPPRRAGSLLVVVGAGDEARRVAATVAGETGIDLRGVAFASPDAHSLASAGSGRLLRTAVEAAEHSPSWRRGGPALVVVDAPVTGGERSWADHLIGALRPTAVWGVVDSTCKAEDIATWASELGGMDALALENLAGSVSPCTALAVGVPVARLDGRSATAQCWAATIVAAVNSADLSDLPQPGGGAL
ncbi:MAG TPA: hypothetical protein VNC61_14635 [Acidimicrobiales bacterium]|nr:hypothetical protein [Acidimicrobiales bacterium]